MKIKQYQIDAFAEKVFAGNPAAVCPLQSWLADDVMQAIAAENNLSETAFFVPSAKGYALRWFTPEHEVDLCGHATLAAAYVLFTQLGYKKSVIVFETRSGELMVEQHGKLLCMNFPACTPQPCEPPALLRQALGRTPDAVLAAADYIVVFESEEIIRDLKPNMMLLSQLDLRCVCVTALGNEVDFVSRVFAPKYGINEDPVTGSTHCELVPYWADKLRKNTFTAKQLSRRGGNIFCELQGDRVLLSGTAVLFMTAEFEI